MHDSRGQVWRGPPVSAALARLTPTGAVRVPGIAREVPMPDRRLDASALRDWAHTAVGDLITHTDEINRLNVFPVADSDTGTNMLFTMRSDSIAIAKSILLEGMVS